MKGLDYLKTGGSILIVFCVLYILNAWMPLHRDDYEYALIWNTSSPIRSMGDVFDSLQRHYFSHGGRMVSFFFLDSFLLFGKPFFNVMNTLVFCGLVLLTCFHARRSLSLRGMGGEFLGMAVLAWLTLPHFGEVVIWMCGATVYLWTAFFAALFLLPYNLYFAGRLPRVVLGFPVLMFLLGFLAGCSVENLAVTCTALSLFSAMVQQYRKKPVLWMWTGGVGAMLGSLLLIAAPGNYVRYEGTGDKGFLLHIGNQFAGQGEMLLFLLPALLLLTLCFQVLRADGGKGRGKLSCRSLLFVVPIFLWSYLSGRPIGNALYHGIVNFILVPLHKDSEKATAHLANVLASFEEVVLYLAMVVLIYSIVKYALSSGKATKHWWAIFSCNEEVRYAVGLIALAFFNNFVLIAAPTFPGRAAFSSTVMVLIAVMAVWRMEHVQEAFCGTARRYVIFGAIALSAFFFYGTATALYHIQDEDARRIAVMEEARGTDKVVVFPPSPYKTCAIRHVFYVDFDNGVTKYGLCRYYGIKDIRIDPQATLPQR